MGPGDGPFERNGSVSSRTALVQIHRLRQQQKNAVTETKCRAIPNFSDVFARKIHQRPVTSSNQLDRHYESEEIFRPKNKGTIFWGYDPPGKPETPIFR